MAREVKVPNRIREIRKSKGIGLKNFAYMTGIAQRQLQCYEHGDNIPNAIIALRIADCLNCSVKDLYNVAELSESDSTVAE